MQAGISNDKRTLHDLYKPPPHATRCVLKNNCTRAAGHHRNPRGDGAVHERLPSHHERLRPDDDGGENRDGNRSETLKL